MSETATPRELRVEGEQGSEADEHRGAGPPWAGDRDHGEGHAAAVSPHFMHYNFARTHKTLRVTPAMEAGISDHVWSLEEIVRLLS
jgi:hypothetical protein